MSKCHQHCSTNSSQFLQSHLDIILQSLPPRAKVLDLACGWGQNGLVFSKYGFHVDFMDKNSECIAFVQQQLDLGNLSGTAKIANFETGNFQLMEKYNLILVFRYLFRPLFKTLLSALLPNGLLVYETFTKAQMQFIGPRNPIFLLDNGELESLVPEIGLLENYKIFSMQNKIASEALIWQNKIN